jgi:putative transposase
MYEDEAIFQQSGSTIRSWAPKGRGRTVDSFPGRKSEKALGAVTIEENPRFHFRFAPVFNTETFGAFLRQIIRQYPHEKVHMVLDNVRYHHAKGLQGWLEENKDRIKLHFLPAYSPQFNPIEKVWKATKKASIHNRYFETLGQLRKALF